MIFSCSFSVDAETRAQDEQQEEFGIHSAINEDDEDWKKAEEDSYESGVQTWSTTGGTNNSQEIATDVEEVDDGVTWQARPKSWWLSFMAAKSRTRAFSFYGVVESALTGITKFIGSMIGDDDNDDEADYQSAGVNYKGYQLLRITPKNAKQVQHLQKLRDSEPDDVKFWTTPIKNK